MLSMPADVLKVLGELAGLVMRRHDRGNHRDALPMSTVTVKNALLVVTESWTSESVIESRLTSTRAQRHAELETERGRLLHRPDALYGMLHS